MWSSVATCSATSTGFSNGSNKTEVASCIWLGLGRQACQHRQGLEMLERVNQIMVRPTIDVKAGVAGGPELLQVLPPLVLQVDAAPRTTCPT